MSSVQTVGLPSLLQRRGMATTMTSCVTKPENNVSSRGSPSIGELCRWRYLDIWSPALKGYGKFGLLEWDRSVTGSTTSSSLTKVDSCADIDTDSDFDILSPRTSNIHVKGSQDQQDWWVAEAVLEGIVSDVVVECGERIAVSAFDRDSVGQVFMAASEGFASMVGRERHELIGADCRQLSDRTCHELTEPEVVATLRESWASGSPCAVVVVNRRATGELFQNMIQIRPVVAGRHGVSQKDKVYLVGVHRDVTDLCDDPEALNEVRGELERESASLCSNISARICSELSESTDFFPAC
eukprot:TRINITY_DN121706_c0_g1_i1.p1 TRINITY_DN121706_c0_g1~~TRINITY_DN121706_c0_g1_i1.p1  ORF type:complete len:315 (+),score=46.29 TRINITY_DN121706_c0_g1_i1:52-945(+)